MALLSDGARLEIWAEVMRDFSQSNLETPITKTDLRSLINYMDGQLETTESSIIAGLPAGDGKTWLLANQSIGRELLARVQQKRQEEI